MCGHTVVRLWGRDLNYVFIARSFAGGCSLAGICRGRDVSFVLRTHSGRVRSGDPEEEDKTTCRQDLMELCQDTAHVQGLCICEHSQRRCRRLEDGELGYNIQDIRLGLTLAVFT